MCLYKRREQGSKARQEYIFLNQTLKDDWMLFQRISHSILKIGESLPGGQAQNIEAFAFNKTKQINNNNKRTE